jgi:3-isopropylmalate/(R)-2-methylmalate dehydratase large subunit
MFGVGSTEMLGVLVTGEIWLKVPHTIRMEWNGRLGRGVTAKDIMLFLCTRFGLDGGQYQALEYAGSAIRALPMQERMTLANMSAELGGQVGLIAPDEVTREYLKSVGVADAEIDLASWQSDSDAPLGAHHQFDAGALAPQVAAPHSPANAHPVADLAGTPLDAAYIGACTGAKLADLRMAATVLRGKKIASGMRLLLAPASLQDQRVAAAEGTLAAIVDAGAQLIGNACGACAGYGAFQFGEKQRVISSTARNFRGRMGADSAEIYLGNPYTVAASALAGRIADPREVIQ